LTKAFVNLPGGGTAIYISSGLAYYRHSDWLGSSRLTSTQARGLYSSQAYAPFGEQYATYPTSGSVDPSYTGQNSDTVSSLYDFTFREHSMSQGRWISPDPLGTGAVDPTTPQTWNRYAYVAGNPLSFIDATGLNRSVGGSYCQPDISNCAGGGGIGNGGLGVGDGSFCTGGQCIAWNFGPGYNVSSTIGATELLAQENGWYAAMVNCGLNPGSCPASGTNPEGVGSNGILYQTITINCEGTISGDSVTLGQCAAPLQVSGPVSAGLQSIYNIYSNTLFGMISSGNRRPGSGLVNASLNNLESWGNNYYSCNQQASWLTACLSVGGPSDWDYIFHGVNDLLPGVPFHYITVALPNSAGNPTVFMDPWLNEINVVRP
jgi:RHS repeat-associated protein